MLSDEKVKKLQLKLLGVSVDEQLRFTTHMTSLVGVISKLRKLIHTSANCSITTSRCQLMPDARKLENLQEGALLAVCCNKRIITFG